MAAFVGEALLRVDIGVDGTPRVCSAGRWPTLDTAPAAVADLDADGTPDIVASSTCSGCTSNHVFARGVK